MTDFAVAGARALPHAAAPTIAFGLRIRDPRPIQAILLNCQLRIEPRRRPHTLEEKQRLADIFGAPDRWGETLHPLTWTQATVNVPAFEGGAKVNLPVPCTYDFEVTAAKYLAAMENGEIPLRFLFSGTIFVKSETGFLVEQIPWSKDAAYRMPVAIWREVMNFYFPSSGWIRLQRDTLARLQRERAQHGYTSWEELFESLLAESTHKGELKCAPLAGPSR
ncbi:MAG TPA: DUF6084 family protein [Bryobacteraceae bacterium]|jgi:hypothetical protein|nr:DUF6084 family protein [Bryobacteraceae bacterium]